MASSIQDSGSAFQYTKTIPKGGYEEEGKHGNNKNLDSLQVPRPCWDWVIWSWPELELDNIALFTFISYLL